MIALPALSDADRQRNRKLAQEQMRVNAANGWSNRVIEGDRLHETWLGMCTEDAFEAWFKFYGVGYRRANPLCTRHEDLEEDYTLLATGTTVGVIGRPVTTKPEEIARYDSWFYPARRIALPLPDWVAYLATTKDATRHWLLGVAPGPAVEASPKKRERTTNAFTHYVPREHFQHAPAWAIDRGIEAVRKVGVDAVE